MSMVSNDITQNTGTNKLTIRIENDPRLLLVLLAFCEKNIVRYAVHVFSFIPILGQLSGVIVPAAYIILLLCFAQRYGLRVSAREILVPVFVVVAILVTAIIYPVNTKYIFDSNNFWNGIFPCLRWFIIGLVLIPDRETLDLLGKVSCLAILVETAFVLLYMMPRGLLASDDMSRSYQLLPNILLALNYSFGKKKVLSWICAIVGIIYSLSMGTRGPVVIILAYVFLRILQSSRVKTAYKLLLGLALAGISVLFLNSDLYLTILKFAKVQLGNVGLSTRVIDLAISGEMTTHLSGRDELYGTLIKKISEHPFLGYGVYGEWQWISWSAHNVYLEVMVHFGVILGSLLILWYVVNVLRSYIKTKNVYSREMILMWACFVFVRGVFGGSWLQLGVFFLIGFCLREQSRIKEDRLQESYL